MTDGIDDLSPEEPEDFNPYHIVYNPSTVDLMGKIGTDNFTIPDVIEYLTGRKLESCTEKNYTGYLSFRQELLRKGMLEQMAIESYGSYYIANQICKADPTARVILADDRRRTIGQIISREKKKPVAVFITAMSSNFQAACIASIILNRVNIPVIIGGIHVSTSPSDVETYIHPYIQYPQLLTRVIGAGDSNTIKQILSDIAESVQKNEYRGTVQIEDGIWGDSRVSELPKIRPPFIRKLPIAGFFLSRMIDTNVTTPFLGCPFSCSFCSISSFPEESRKLTTRTPDDFVNELLDKQRTGVSFKNRFYFISPDNLLAGARKLYDVLDKMIESPLSINYAAQISIEVADDEPLLRKLRKSGASHFFIGLESLDIRNLEIVGKNIAAKIRKAGTTVEEYYTERIKKIQDYGISIHGAFMFGMPFDYFNSLSDHTGTVIADFCLKNRIGLQPSCFSKLPGSLDFIDSLNKNELIYGNPGTLDYFLSLSIADLTESNGTLPDTLFNSPLVSFFIMYDAIKKVGSYFNALKTGFQMAGKAWKAPTATGGLSIKEKAVDAFAALGFQLGASTYLELYSELAHSTKWLKGSFERLYEREKNSEVKNMFGKYVKAFQ